MTVAAGSRVARAVGWFLPLGVLVCACVGRTEKGVSRGRGGGVVVGRGEKLG